MPLPSNHLLWDVPKTTPEEIVQLIKYNEVYASCCKIIEERRLHGQEILNLSETRLGTWRIPRWLIRNLLSLKTTLLKNPEMLLRPDEKDDEVQPVQINSNLSKSDARKNITNKLETLFKPQESPSTGLKRGTLHRSQEEIDFTDEDNYLIPLALAKNHSIESAGRPSKKKHALKNLPRGLHPFREPIALPREDPEEGSENEYEPPPNIKKFPPALLSKEKHGQPSRLHQSQQSIAEDVYEDPDANIEEKFVNIPPKGLAPAVRSNSKIAPPLLERTFDWKNENRTPLTPNIFVQYMNVKQPRAEVKNNDLISEKPVLRNFQTTANVSSTKAKSPLRNDKNLSTRPLPPIPNRFDAETRFQSINTFIDNTSKNDENEEFEEGEYENRVQEKEDTETEDQPEYLNTSEITKPPNPELKSKRTSGGSQYLNELVSKISEVKLNPVTPRKELVLDNSLAADLRRKLSELKTRKNSDSKEGQKQTAKPEFISKTPHKLPLPPAVIPQNIPDTYSQEEFSDGTEDEYDDLYNLNNEKFYRNTDRKGAKSLLQDLEDGAFLLRPSKNFFLSITVKKNGKYYNIGIKKDANQKIYCGEGVMKTPEFSSITAFLAHFEHTPFVFQANYGEEEVYLKKVLPYDRF